MTEIQKFSEELALIFPERLTRPIVKFNAYKLAKYWKSNEKTTDNRMSNIKKNPNWLSIPVNSELFAELENNLVEQLGDERSKVCRQIIEIYRNKKISGLEFHNRLFEELGRVSGDIKLSLEEISFLFGMSENYMGDLRSMIINSNHRDYCPNYKFSIEILDFLSDNLNYYFGEKAKKCYDLIEKYKNANKDDLKEYSHQQYNVEKPHYFKTLNSEEALYWFGFISHDGYLIKGRYDIGIELSVKDRDRLLKFAEAIGLDLGKNDIKDFLRKKINNGKLLERYSSEIRFTCKPMYEELQNQGIIGSKSNRKEVPQVIKEYINKAKLEGSVLGINWKYTDSGRKSLAWLYGMYDADGSMREHYSGRLYSSIKSYLQEIKSLFEIEGDVLTQSEQGDELEVFGHTVVTIGMFKLHLSSDIFTPMIQSCDQGLDRKNPDKIILNRDNYLGFKS